MLAKQYRLSDRIQIEKVKAKGTRFNSPFFNLVVLPSGAGNVRFCLVTPKAVIKTAVARNYTKRAASEYIQPLLPHLGDYDVIIFFKTRIEKVKMQETLKSLLELFIKAGIKK